MLEGNDCHLVLDLVSSSVCPPKWIGRPGSTSCYRFPDITAGFGGARKYCKSYGGDLVVVNGKWEWVSCGQIPRFLNEVFGSIWVMNAFLSIHELLEVC